MSYKANVEKAKSFIAGIDAWDLPENCSRREAIEKFREIAGVASRFAEWLDSLTDEEFYNLTGMRFL